MNLSQGKGNSPISDSIESHQTDLLGLKETAQSVGFGSPQTAKQLFNPMASRENQAEPRTPVSRNQTPGEGSDSATNYNTFVYETLTWTNKPRSVLYLLSGLLLIGIVYGLLVSRLTFITGACNVALLQLSLNSMRYVLSPELQEHCTWYDSSLLLSVLKGAGSALQGLAALHDRHLDGRDSLKTLKIGTVVWLIGIMGRYVSSFQLALGLWLLAFSVPKAYQLYGDKVNKATADGFNKGKERFLAIDQRLRAVMVVLPILGAGYVLSSMDLVVAVFLMLTYLRSLLHKGQMDMLHKRAAPLGNTAKKGMSLLNNTAYNLDQRYQLTPGKAKRA